MGNETGKAVADSHAQATDTVKANDGSTSPPARTYSEKEHLDAMNAARTEAVRNYKSTVVDPIIKERDELKLKAVEIQNTKDTIADLEEQIELLTKGDADKLTFATLHRQLREQQAKLATEKAQLEASKETHAQKLARLVEEDREAAVLEVVTEFEVKPEVLSTFAKNHNLSTAEAIRKEAALYWSAKAREETPPVTTISGHSSGNGKRVYTEAEISDFKFWKEHKDDIELARTEGRIK